VEKKKTTLFFLIIVVIGIFNLADKGKCLTYVYVWYFNSDKDIYYNDEEICINASWDLDYGAGESSYIQIKIFDENWDLLWNSYQYNQTGTHLQGEWYVKIAELALPFNNTSNDLILVFYYYINTGSVFEDHIEERYIQAIKRNVSCELIDFNQNLNYGDILQFKARFYSLENNSDLINHLINVKVVSNNVIHYIKNFTTNSFGIIEVLIATAENITFGVYNLIIEVAGNIYYKKSTFEYQILIDSNLDKDSGINDSQSKEQDKDHLNILPFIFSILSISILAFLIFYHSNIKRTKQKDLADLTFKY